MAMVDLAIDKNWDRPFFSAVYFAVCAGLLLSIATLNFVVDPFELYGTKLFLPLEFNRYDKKIELYRALDNSPQALILGSSCTESFDPELVFNLTGKRCFNFAQPAARPETLLADLKLALSENKVPVDSVIVGVEPLFFHPKTPVHPQAEFSESLRPFLKDRSILKFMIGKVERLISIEQLSASYDVLKRERSGTKEPDVISYRNDGFAVYPRRETELAEGKLDLGEIIEKRALRYPDQIFQISTFTGLSPERTETFREFVDLCRDNGIKMYVFMPPVHPCLWDSLKARGAEPIYKETARFLSSVVTESGGVFRDYTHIESFDGSPNEFHDVVHMTKSNCDLLLRNLLSGQ